jgi:kinesin family member 5
LSEMIQKLQDQLTEQEEWIAAARRERDAAQQESQRQQALSEASMSEVKEVLQALEELAVNYDQKSQEVQTKDKENEALVEELTAKTVRHFRLFIFSSVPSLSDIVYLEQKLEVT